MSTMCDVPNGCGGVSTVKFFVPHKTSVMNPICLRALRPVSDVCARHCIVVHNVAYDVRHFDHPGGRVLLELCKGRDATELFEMCHVNHAAALRALKTLPIAGHTAYPSRHEYTRYATLRSAVLELFPTRASRSASMGTHIRVLACTLCTLALHLILLFRTHTATVSWFVLCLLSAFANTMLGAYGHNGVHRVQPHALGLDWNGLSSFEWLSEHVMSHHPHVNTECDHDALSLEPLLSWLPRRSGMCGRAQTSWVRHVVYMFSELIVAFQGTCVHATRWRAVAHGAPWWMCVAPLLFIARVASYYWCHPPLLATLTLLATMIPAGYAFSTLAHLTHDHVADSCSRCMVERQLSNTRDVEPVGLRGEMTLFLDRQCAHHLFPTIDHRRFSREFVMFTRSTTHILHKPPHSDT